MPSKPKVRTYSRIKKFYSKYVPKPISPFKVTEASTVIDALFSKNIKKRNLYNKNKIPELPTPTTPSLNNDTLDLKINSTFDNLLQGPQYVKVNFRNKSSFCGNSSTETSISKSAVEKTFYNTRKNERKDYAYLHSGDKIVSKAKVKKKNKANNKQITNVVKNVVTNNSNNKTKLYKYLDNSINYSLIIDKKQETNAMKYTTTTPKFLPIDKKSLKGVHLIYNSSIHSSTPIVQNKFSEKLVDMSPICGKSQINFSNSKSLFESKIDLSSIQCTPNRNESDVLITNSTIPSNKDQEFNKSAKKCDIKTDAKLNANAVVVVENNLDILGIKGKVKFTSEPVVSVERLPSIYFSPNESTKNSCLNSQEDSTNDDIVVEDSIVDEKLKNFVTTRKKKVQIMDKSNIYRINPAISMQEWEKLSQSRVNLVRYDENYKGDCVKMCSNVNKMTENRKTTTDNLDLTRKSLFLQPGKKWFRSLSILRQTNILAINNQSVNKGRNWRKTIYEVIRQQKNGVSNEVLNNETIKKLNKSSVELRKSLKIVNNSIINFNVDETKCTPLENNSGYVSTLANESILESFNKLSLTTNVDDREATARQIVLKRCGQTEPIAFNDCYSARTLKKCRKIGEGVYGEVFMYKSANNECRVMKIIPIEGHLVVNGEHQKKYEEIISEIIITSELSNLRTNNEFQTNGFAELQQIYCVQGKYPQQLIDLWNLYDEDRGSENDSPDIFDDNQLFVILELENGGQDLEAYRFNNAEQSYALFIQVVCTLAVAESALEFEHRDMHWGNILISPAKEPTSTFKLNGREFEVATKGVKVSIIDFTLSRMTYNNCCIYNDLALDPDLFTATGDYQFDIYRLMRQRNNDDWQKFEPYSNILWLDYTLDKMINQLRYLRVTSKTHKTFIRRLSQIKTKILDFDSATELLNSAVFSHVFL